MSRKRSHHMIIGTTSSSLSSQDKLRPIPLLVPSSQNEISSDDDDDDDDGLTTRRLDLIEEFTKNFDRRLTDNSQRITNNEQVVNKRLETIANDLLGLKTQLNSQSEQIQKLFKIIFNSKRKIFKNN